MLAGARKSYFRARLFSGKLLTEGTEAGEEEAWMLTLVNKWNPMESGYKPAVASSAFLFIFFVSTHFSSPRMLIIEAPCIKNASKYKYFDAEEQKELAARWGEYLGCEMVSSQSYPNGIMPGSLSSIST